MLSIFVLFNHKFVKYSKGSFELDYKLHFYSKYFLEIAFITAFVIVLAGNLNYDYRNFSCHI